MVQGCRVQVQVQVRVLVQVQQCRVRVQGTAWGLGLGRDRSSARRRILERTRTRWLLTVSTRGGQHSSWLVVHVADALPHADASCTKRDESPFRPTCWGGGRRSTSIPGILEAGE